jgi:D-arabinose 1-dehydrogenase-like Zn-dependent alcohol dehydrogenase
MTTYKAIKVGNVRPGDLVVVSGVGGLGHLAVQYAKIFGGTVAAVDITDEKLKLASELGADPLLRAIRATQFTGRCGQCEWADLCGGSRARAYAACRWSRWPGPTVSSCTARTRPAVRIASHHDPLRLVLQ